MPKIGLLVGRENTFPSAFIAHINSLPHGFSAEYITLGGSRIDEAPEYAVIIDRVSHDVPYYRSYVKNAALQGTVVINDPFWFPADDKFIGTAIARRIGVAVPRTVALPNHSYSEDISSGSLRNLVYPLPWEEIAAYIGFPAFLKPSVGGGWHDVHRVGSIEELVYYYDQSGRASMILQEAIEFEQYIRCLCFGGEHILPLRYDPLQPDMYRRYEGIAGEAQLGSALHARVIDDARRLNRALGYTMNTVEFAIRDGVPYAIDFLNPVCDLDDFSIGQEAFDWAVRTLADLAVRYATQGAPASHAYLWQGSVAGVSAPVVRTGATPAPSGDALPARLRAGRNTGGAPGSQEQGVANTPSGGEMPRAARKRNVKSS